MTFRPRSAAWCTLLEGVSGSWLPDEEELTMRRVAFAGFLVATTCVLSENSALASTPIWRLQPTTNPSVAKVSQLSGVSCPSLGVCTAVGFFEHNVNGENFTLAEHWNGSSWAIQPTPNPAGTQGTVLVGVSCASTSACT